MHTAALMARSFQAGTTVTSIFTAVAAATVR
jgi:hypothetical protein